MGGKLRSPTYPLKIVTGSVMAAIDRSAIDTRGVSGLYLMERAGEGVANAMMVTLSPEQLRGTVVLCGRGNNGGDGFVIARRLARNGFNPLAALIGNPGDLKGDALTNYTILSEEGVPVFSCDSESELNQFTDRAGSALVWVDALLGTGARGAPRGLLAEAVSILNKASYRSTIVSVDISSGVEADTGRVEGEAVRADWVYTMGLPKVGHVVPPGNSFYKNLTILDIGFPADLLNDAESDALLLSSYDIDRWIPRREVSTHKGKEGHLLVIAGSRGMTGAALMCAKAAVATGAGLVTAVCPASLLPIYAAGVWEMMTLPVNETQTGAISEEAFQQILDSGVRYNAIALGPGLGRHPSTMALVKRILRDIDVPVLCDGDALFVLSADDFKQRKSPWVATPHSGEMARLFETDVPDIESNRWEYARRLSSGTRGAAVLKGPNSVIATGDGLLRVNSTGSPVMASGGMGDVLAGMISAFLAKGIHPGLAASAGVYLHGLSAEIAAKENHAEAVCATQVIANIQKALHRVRCSKALKDN